LERKKGERMGWNIKVLSEAQLTKLKRYYSELKDYSVYMYKRNIETHERYIKINRPHVAGIQDWCLFNLLMCTGARVSEVRTLRKRNLMIDVKMVKLDRTKSKGKNARLDFDIPEFGMGILKEYLYIKQKILFEPWEDDDCLFRGERSATGAVAASGYFRRFKKAMILNDMPSNISPHALRHTFAVRMLNQGAHSYQVRDQLRHSNIAVTDVYTRYVERNRKVIDTLKF
jgi:site-specific recombinase XerD